MTVLPPEGSTNLASAINFRPRLGLPQPTLRGRRSARFRGKIVGGALRGRNHHPTRRFRANRRACSS
jgi:hypothetical protein